MKKIVFMGTPEYASKILKEILNNNFDVVALFTQPDRPVGRSAVLMPPDIKKMVLESGLNIPIFQPISLRDGELERLIASFKPDFIVVAAYGQILPKSILDIAPCINLHASILPKFRGASPIQMAILNSEVLSGVTAMRMGVGLDDGDILGFSIMNISKHDSQTLFDKFALLAGELIIKILNQFDKISPIEQISALSSKCGKILKSDGLVDLELQSPHQIHDKFRAYSPWPGIYLKNGTKILDMDISDLQGQVGTILKIENDGFIVGLNSGGIKIKSLQEIGKKRVSARDYLNGKRLLVGNKFC